jgi:hypothetical protein
VHAVFINANFGITLTYVVYESSRQATAIPGHGVAGVQLYKVFPLSGGRFRWGWNLHAIHPHPVSNAHQPPPQGGGVNHFIFNRKIMDCFVVALLAMTVKNNELLRRVPPPAAHHTCRSPPATLRSRLKAPALEADGSHARSLRLSHSRLTALILAAYGSRAQCTAHALAAYGSCARS